MYLRNKGDVVANNKPFAVLLWSLLAGAIAFGANLFGGIVNLRDLVTPIPPPGVIIQQPATVEIDDSSIQKLADRLKSDHSGRLMTSVDQGGEHLSTGLPSSSERGSFIVRNSIPEAVATSSGEAAPAMPVHTLDPIEAAHD